MKSFRKTLALLSMFLLLFGVCPLISHAKDMEECYHCHKTGQYQCESCRNAGELTCDGCGGSGSWVCPGEEGKGQCDSGWYVCPSCEGDGLSRPIPADGNAGPCGQCGGSGKLECWHCHGAGGGVCDRCNGTGKTECQNTDCKTARTIGWKCPYCKGTGFLGDGPNFPREWNDGVHNVPEKGDFIITDHANWQGYYYGVDKDPGQNQGGDSGGDAGGNGGGNSAARDPKTGRDYIWQVDLGDGTWEAGGHTVTAYKDGSPASGVVEVKYHDPIRLSGIPEGIRVRVYLEGAGGFKVELELSGGDEVAVGRHTPEKTTVPFNVSLTPCV